MQLCGSLDFSQKEQKKPLLDYNLVGHRQLYSGTSLLKQIEKGAVIPPETELTLVQLKGKANGAIII